MTSHAGGGPGVLVPLRHGLTGRACADAVVRVLTGADEATLSAATQAGERWVSLVLTTAVEDLGGQPPSPDEVRSLTVGDRCSLLLGVLAGTYGARIDWFVECPACGAELDASIDLEELVRSMITEAADPVGPGVRLPTGADLEAVAELASADEARELLLSRCVESWRALGEAEIAAVESAMAAADPLADLDLLLTCAACAASVPAALDPAAELAARLTSADRLIADVHALALAYGWTEPDVLALPVPRRARYLTLIADGGRS